MAQTLCVIPPAEDRARLAAIVGDRNRPHKHIQRARIILLSADRLPVMEVARRAGSSRPTVWPWQQRYGEKASTGCCATRRARLAGRGCRRAPWLTLHPDCPQS